MTTYHFVAASEKFLTVEEPLEEVLKERRRHYAETNREIDFWLVIPPAFLQAPELAELASQVPQPSAAVVSTCLLYTSPSPRDGLLSRMPSSA